MEFKIGHRMVCLTMPTGAGKTVTFSDIAHRAAHRGYSVLAMVHRGELVRQISLAFDAVGLPHGIIQAGRRPRPSEPVQVATVQTLANRTAQYNPDLIICDECFPAGTKVDGQSIEDIRVGDYVWSMTEKGELQKKKVLHVFRSCPKSALVRIFAGGKFLFDCTPGHPVWTFRGYVAAIDLQPTDMILHWEKYYENEYVHGLPEIVSKQIPKKKLFEKVFRALAFGDYGINEQKICQRQNEAKQSDVSNRICTKNEILIKEDWTQTTGARGQWKARATTSTPVGLCAGVANGVCREDAEIQMELSENRHCEPRINDWRGGGRQQPLFAFPARTGQRKASGFRILGVDYIEVHEQASQTEPSGVCPDGCVYNIEVEDNNNYFANGTLVHNCHHCTSPTYRRILEAYPAARVLGVTATPCRLDGTGLGSVGYTKLIHGPDTAWLTAHSYLCPAEVYAPGGVDISAVRTTAGDYNRKGLAAAMDKPTITGDAVQHYTRLCPGVPAIAFCVSVKHAEHVAEQFTQAGYRAASIDGRMSAPERLRRLQGLADGSVQVLTSCDLISEGVDVPAVTAGIMLRPTQSLSLWYQQIGRCLRMSPGKANAVILDHVGNTRRHGLPWLNPPKWTLDSQRRTRRSTEEDTGPAVRICPRCFRAFPSVPNCPHCGEVYPVQAREVATVAGELVKLDAAYAEAKPGLETWRASSLEDFEQIAAERGYKPGWARIQWDIRQRKRRSA